MTFAQIPHTEACLAHQEEVKEIEARVTRWRAAYPQYCRTCDGRGVVMIDSGDDSVGLDAEYGFCDTCILAGTCPRCGKAHFNAIAADDELMPVTPGIYEHDCKQCGYVFDGMQDCVANLLESVAYTDTCICIDERYAQWVKEHPPTRREEALGMGMTPTEADAYEQTGDLPDSYLRRADTEYDAQRERRSMRRF